MKLCIYTDPHISQHSSILTGYDSDTGMSLRLVNLVNTFSWINEIAKEYKCDRIISLGDTTDKSYLNAAEITAMDMCNMTDHYLILGNHCRDSLDGSVNSINTYPHVFSNPYLLNENVLLLPYDPHHTPIDSILKNFGKDSIDIILSHNDIKGAVYSSNYSSSTGYEQSDILSSCKLFINGHIHTPSDVVTNRIINLGSITGLNFSSSNLGRVMILDTESLEYEYLTNPYSLIFLKYYVRSESDILKFSNRLSELSQYSVVLHVVVEESLLHDVTQLIELYSNILASRLNLEYQRDTYTPSPSDNSVSESKFTLTNSNESIISKYVQYLNTSSFLTSDELSTLSELFISHDKKE